MKVVSSFYRKFFVKSRIFTNEKPRLSAGFSTGTPFAKGIPYPTLVGLESERVRLHAGLFQKTARAIRAIGSAFDPDKPLRGFLTPLYQSKDGESMAVYKDEEKGTWYAKFRYTDWTGKGRSTTKRGFKTKREAKAYEVDFKRQSQEMPDMTVRELCRRYLEAMKPRWKESTYIVRSNFLSTYVLAVIGDMPLSNITKSTIVEWQNWLIASGKCESTMNTINAALTALLNYAVKMEWISRSPASNLQRVGKVAKRLDFWTLAEYERFLEAGRSDRDFEKFHLAFDILFFSGIRIGEYLGLGKDSFDFAKNQIIILHTIDTHTGKKSTPKNQQSYRRITMPKSIMVRVREYINSLYEVPETKCFGISRDMLFHRMKKWATKANLPRIALHGLRHSNASHLISLGIPITVISRRLGHRSPKVTLDIYSHMYQEDESGVGDILDEMLNVGQSAVRAKK